MEAGTPDLIKLEDLDAAAGALTGRKHVLSIMVENRPGVLARIAGLFSRRGFNIDTLAVGPTEDPDVSRITLTVDGAVHPIDQVTKQLHKLVNVIKIRDMEPGETIAREMALFKVSAPIESRAEIMQFAEIFRAKIVDVSRRSLTIEVTGSADKIEAFERMIRPHGLIEMVRTGEVAIARSKPDADTESPPASRRAGRSLRRRSRCSTARGRAAAAPGLGGLSPRPPRWRRLDPTRARVLGSRLASDRWFCWEQPDRDGFALAGLGTALRGRQPRRRPLRGRSPRAAPEPTRDRVADEPERPARRRRDRSGPPGFAFDPEGGSEPNGPRCRRRWRCCPSCRSPGREGGAFLTASAGGRARARRRASARADRAAGSARCGRRR